MIVSALRMIGNHRRSEFRSSNTFSHGRVAENVAWLRMGFHFFPMFPDYHLCYGETYLAQMEERFKEILYRIAHRQSNAINLDKPTHLFLRKCYAMLHQLREVEHAYDIVLGKLSAEDMNTVCDFVSLCEGINERMLAFACQKMVFSPEA